MSLAQQRAIYSALSSSSTAVAKELAALDGALPAALLPLRLEARFHPSSNPTELRIRVYPEPLHTLTNNQLAGLPQRWVAVGVQSTRVCFVQQGGLIASNLRAGPNFEDGSAPETLASLDALLTQQGIAWLTQYEQALAAGMAITVPLSSLLLGALKQGFDLYVLGLGGRGEGASELSALLRAHAQAGRLDLVPQGSPTNRTELAQPGEAPPAPLGDGGDRRRLGLALGLTVGILDELPNADLNDEDTAQDLARLLWPATLGPLLEETLGPRVLSTGTVESLRQHVIQHLRGGAPYPALRVDDQPYGVLPVAWSDTLGGLNSAQRGLLAVLDQVSTSWDRSLDGVPRMNPEAAEHTQDQREEDLVALLSAQPHAASFRKRERKNRSGFLKGLWDIAVAALSTSPGADLYGRTLQSNLKLQTTLEGQKLSIQGAINTVNTRLARLDGTDGRTGEIATIQAEIAALEVQAEQARKLGSIGANMLNLLNQSLSVKRATLLATQTLRTLCLDSLEGLDAWMEVFIRPQEARLNLLRDNGVGSGAVGGELVDSADPELLYNVFTDVVSDTGPLVQAPKAQGADRAEAWLEALITWVRVEASSPESTGAAPPSKPLLYELLRAAVPKARAELRSSAAEGPSGSTSAGLPSRGTAPGKARSNILDALLRLKTLAASATGVAHLERITAECLGCAAYRIDAWYTSLSRALLASRRSARAQGLHLGGWGVLLDLKPAGAQSPGAYVHAPSLNHAVSAAVLRAGWAAHSEGGGGALALNLSSARVRGATRLLEDIRAGSPPEEALGHVLERRLHDSSCDALLDDLKGLCKRELGHSTRRPLPGLRLARAYLPVDQQDTADKALNTAVEALLKARSTDLADRTRKALRALADDLDGCADALLAESVYQLVQGNTERVIPSLDTLDKGGRSPAELRFAEGSRAGTGLSHRVMLLLPTQGGWRSSPGPRARVNPGLEGLAARVLGSPDKIQILLTSGGTSTSINAAALNLDALDFVWAAPEPDAGQRSELYERILLAVRAKAPVDENNFQIQDPATLAAGQLALSDAVVLARALRHLLSGARPMAPEDLCAPGVEPRSAWSSASARALALALRGELNLATEALKTLLPTPSTLDPAPTPQGDIGALHRAMLALAPFGLPSALPRAGFACLVAEDAADRALLGRQAWTLLGEAQARLTAEAALSAQSAEDEASAVALAGRRLSALVAPGPQAMGGLSPNREELLALQASLKRGPSRRGSPLALESWLLAQSQVQAGVGALNELQLLGESLRGAPSLDLELAQLPDLTIKGQPEAWAGWSRPSAERSCLVCNRDLPSPDQAQEGVVLDAWLERIPPREEVTGLALQWDAPSARAPQAVLIALSRGSWSLAELVATLMHTVRLTRIRAVEPGTLLELGNVLPAIRTV